MAKVKRAELPKVEGTDQDDRLKNSNVAEIIDGGAGFDMLYMQEGRQGVSVNLQKGTMIDAEGNRGQVYNIEVVFGTSLNDTLIGSDRDDILVGNAGNDILRGGAGTDELYGGEGDDALFGGAGSDYMVGGAGNDTFDGGAGFDLVDYSDEGGSQGVVINLAKGSGTDSHGHTDTFRGVEAIRGTDFADQITGSGGNNWLRGGAGNDTIDGGGGDDVLDGGFGDDVVMGGNGADVLTGGRGNDTLDGGRGRDTVDYSTDGGWRGVSVNLATGIAEDSWGDIDTLMGIENVNGTAFDDWIMGDRNANVLTGGAGNDVLTGGAGNDTFVFGAGHGHDRINDFGRGDVLDLRGLGFQSLEDVLAAFRGHDLGAELVTGEDSSIVLVDVNLRDVASLNILFA